MKTLTGSDTITACLLYQEFFDFKPSFKLLLATNHRPLVQDTTHAMWRRIHLVPWRVRIPAEVRDRRFGERLRAELPGILAWALRGCRDWQQHGLQPPGLVADATRSVSR